YIDANSSWWVMNLGHRHPRLVARLKEQADRLCHCAMGTMTNPEAAKLAAELADVAPEGLDRV
ncbi:MAG: aminotransferase class III-fold pyridoxal phosphate-dependent enzyme, partial [Actinobacteria bacterium]|nr:aminotransferase class III-fold pyridoxal phosphate-dependent enzyme [Actinomycetota bacterium]